MTGHSSLVAPLAFIGETGANGRRRYSLGGAVLVKIAAHLSGSDGRGHGFIRPNEAILIANALAPFVRELEESYSKHGADALVRMGAAGPVAVVMATSWQDRFRVSAFPSRVAYVAAAERGGFAMTALHLDMQTLFSAAAVDISHAAAAAIHGDPAE